ncbi:hypothetical protein KMW28_11955 [Flammeovirga yaeyamensis]|uniref:Uncharacterized protein n=1 Tax=Flammeovirga yaeyamensis TaxID=367791 RepID=A0AAX1MZ05_9BACT|nr:MULTISPECIES: hypothetical protein [Flammeovirga]ANQ48206.1 hypothetical protein MY04_0824 [Flammeovirga sp. MY04]MBB3696122.1 hypothetical protein [Flammeovirga yaeyamensis]NMF34806.1 hypothetical protein [Flammeovirga yaeyamensis]QWG00366.1 hypothetical protein KMW28_11955 [Flammeovirga yaeyamensis]
MTKLVISIENEKNASLVKDLLKDLSFIESIDELKEKVDTENVLKHLEDIKKQKDVNISVQWKSISV